MDPVRQPSSTPAHRKPARAIAPRVRPAEPARQIPRGRVDEARDRASDLLRALASARLSDRGYPCPAARARLDRAIETTRRMVGVLDNAAARLDPSHGGLDLSILDEA